MCVGYYLELSGATWSYFGIAGASWSDLVLPEVICSCPCLSGAIWNYLELLELSGASCSYLELPGAIWGSLELYGAIGCFLGLS